MNKYRDSIKLVQSCIEGNDVAWSTFVDKYIGIVYKAISLIFIKYKNNFDANDINDICQDTFIKLYINDCSVLKKYDYSKSRLSTWLTIISRNIAIDHIRSEKCSTTIVGDISDDMGLSQAVEKEKITIPDDVISPRQHLVLRMLYDDGLDVRETARLLNVKEQTIRSLHHRAIKKLREHYGQETVVKRSSSLADITQP